MKQIILFVMIIILSACTKPIEPITIPLALTQINGEMLWNRVTMESSYKSYSFWPGHSGIQAGQSPHGVYHKIYINKILADALPIKSKIAPEGTIIVKENLTSEKVLDAITVMAKVKGYNPDAGDWFWVKYSPKGEILAEGKPKGCVACHLGMAGNDFIIVRSLDSETDLNS